MQIYQQQNGSHASEGIDKGVLPRLSSDEKFRKLTDALQVLDSERQQSLLTKLSDRQRQVFELKRNGLSRKEIAAALRVTTERVRQLEKKIFRNLSDENFKAIA